MEGNTLISEFTNSVHSSATSELLVYVAERGILGDIFRLARKLSSEAHDRQGSAIGGQNRPAGLGTTVISSASEQEKMSGPVRHGGQDDRAIQGIAPKKRSLERKTRDSSKLTMARPIFASRKPVFGGRTEL